MVSDSSRVSAKALMKLGLWGLGMFAAYRLAKGDSPKQAVKETVAKPVEVVETVAKEVKKVAKAVKPKSKKKKSKK